MHETPQSATQIQLLQPVQGQAQVGQQQQRSPPIPTANNEMLAVDCVISTNFIYLPY